MLQSGHCCRRLSRHHQLNWLSCSMLSACWKFVLVIQRRQTLTPMVGRLPNFMLTRSKPSLTGGWSVGQTLLSSRRTLTLLSSLLPNKSWSIRRLRRRLLVMAPLIVRGETSRSVELGIAPRLKESVTGKSETLTRVNATASMTAAIAQRRDMEQLIIRDPSVGEGLLPYVMCHRI